MTSRRKTIILVTTLCLSFALNAFQFVRGLDLKMGSGQSVHSPDEKYWLQLTSWNRLRFASDQRVFGTIELRNGAPADEPLRTFTVMPITPQWQPVFREARDFVEWSEDSKVATVTTPDFTLSINVEPVTPEKGNWKELMERAREIEEFSAKSESR